MNILRAIKLAMWAPPLPPDPEPARRRLARRLVKRFASGNVRLQQGKYATRRDIDERLEKVKSYDFTD